MELPPTVVEVVLVRLGGCRHAVPMSAVTEVGRPPAVTRVPGLPGFVAGVANWRGRVLAVLELRELLSAGPAAPDGRNRLVVLQVDGVRLGLLVDSVIGGVSYGAHALEPVLPHLPGSRTGQPAGLLAGHVTDEDGPYGVLDLAVLLALAEQLPRARRAG
jgi:purine-binding chemotaxis protein CheW